jgi:hypothetical protein
LYEISVDEEYITQGIEFGRNGALEFSSEGRIYFELPAAVPDANCNSLLNLVVDDVAASLALASWATISGATGYEVNTHEHVSVRADADCRLKS